MCEALLRWSACTTSACVGCFAPSGHRFQQQLSESCVENSVAAERREKPVRQRSGHTKLCARERVLWLRGAVTVLFCSCSLAASGKTSKTRKVGSPHAVAAPRESRNSLNNKLSSFIKARDRRREPLSTGRASRPAIQDWDRPAASGGTCRPRRAWSPSLKMHKRPLDPCRRCSTSVSPRIRRTRTTPVARTRTSPLRLLWHEKYVLVFLLTRLASRRQRLR